MGGLHLRVWHPGPAACLLLHPRGPCLPPIPWLAASSPRASGRAVVERHLADGTLLQNYTAVLEILLRLRQVGAEGCRCRCRGVLLEEPPYPKLTSRRGSVLPPGPQICCAASLAPGEDPSFLSAPHAAAAASAQALDPAALAALVALLRAGLDDECPVCEPLGLLQLLAGRTGAEQGHTPAPQRASFPGASLASGTSSLLTSPPAPTAATCAPAQAWARQKSR